MKLVLVFAHVHQGLSKVLVDYDCRQHPNRILWDLLADSIVDVCRHILEFPSELVERTHSLAQEALHPDIGGTCIVGELAVQILQCILVTFLVASGEMLQVHCRFKYFPGLLSTDDMLPLIAESDSLEAVQHSCCARPGCAGFRVSNGTYINLGSPQCPSSSLYAIKRELNSLDIQVLLASRFQIVELLDTWSAVWARDLPLGVDGELSTVLSDRHQSQYETFVNRFSWLVGAFYHSLNNEQSSTNASNALRDASYFVISPIGTFPENSRFWKVVTSAWRHNQSKLNDFRFAYVALRCSYSTYSEPSVTPWGGRSEDLLLLQDMFRRTTLRDLLQGAYSGLTALRIFSRLRERQYQFVNMNLLKPTFSWKSVESHTFNLHQRGAPVVYITIVDKNWVRFLQAWISHALARTVATHRVWVVGMLGIPDEDDISCGASSVNMSIDDNAFFDYLQSFRSLAKYPEMAWSCLRIDASLGPHIAKYVALSRLLHFGITVVWIDFDTVIVQDPAPWLQNSTSAFSLGLPHYSNWLGDLHDALFCARPEAASFVSRIALWLIENPMLASRPDHFIMACLRHETPYRSGTPGSTHKAWHSIVPMVGDCSDAPLYTILDGMNAYASAFGWAGEAERVFLFHLGGLSFSSKQQLFEDLFMSSGPSQQDVMSLLFRYRREPTYFIRDSSGIVEAATIAAVPRRHELWLEHVTYAENCCNKSLPANIASGILAGVNSSRWYSRKNLSVRFERTHGHLLDDVNSIGAGYWCWKPQVMLQAMDDPTIPEDRGVIVWLDAGDRFIGSLDEILSDVLSVSDVTSHVNLFTVEWMFSKPEALELLPEASQPFVRNTPQIGAPFIVARKTPLARRFLLEWLELMGDRRIISAPGDGYNILYLEKLWKQTGIIHRPSDTRLGNTVESLEYQYFHLHDQVVYSTLFKRYGFKPLTSVQQAKAIALDRDLL